MAGLPVAKADRFRLPYASVSPSITGISGTYKRKHAADDDGSLSTPNSYSEITKRQKYVDHCYGTSFQGKREEVSEDESSGEESSDLRLVHSLSYQTALDTKIARQSSKPNASPTSNKPYSRCSSVSTDEAALSETPKESQTPRKDTVDVSNRKRHFMYTPDDGMKAKMEKYIHNLYTLFDDLDSKDNCWLHTSPPPARKDGRPIGTIQCNFVWKDSFGKHRLHVNVGTVALIIERQLTEEQMEGYVNESWHLSHLCGNWTCCNWRHMTVESGRINLSRNQCFRAATHCSHDPPCMKDRKRRLLVTSTISDQIKRAIEWTRNGVVPTAEGHDSTPMTYGFGCSICGEGVWCNRNHAICPSLTSITKCQQALEKLELCYQQSGKTLEAIAYLKQIITDLIREKEASDAVALKRAVAQGGAECSAYPSQQYSSYGQMLAFLLD